MRLIVSFTFGLLLCTQVYGQQKYTLSGTILDAQSGETLIGASVRATNTLTGAMSNEYGFYSITLPAGKYQMVFALIGYKADTVMIDLLQNIRYEVKLTEQPNELMEIIVSDHAEDEAITRATLGFERLEMKEISKIPVLLGEKDPLKILQLLPGIKSAGEGNSGFHVRGGNSDQNLVLLDEALVYNPSHLLGFFSTFNADAIKDLSIYKGGMPAQYGGRLSSVLDVKMKEGNNQQFHMGGGIGLIASRLYAEGPVAKDKGSFLITARRTYADLFLKLSKDPDINGNTLYFYDLNAKLNYKVSARDKLLLSGYFGRDNFGLGSGFGIDWGNATGTLRWNHIFNDRLFNNMSLIYSNYSYKASVSNGNRDYDLRSSVRDVNFKNEFSYYPHPQHELRFGVNAVAHTLTPRERIAGEGNTSINNTDEKARQSLETSVYVSHRWQASQHWNIETGLRATSFAVLGGSNYYVLNDNYNVTDTITASRWTVVKNYFNLEPRLSIAHILQSSLSVKASYTRNVQNMHLISNSNVSTPNDRWLQSTNVIRPEIADQLAMGVFKNLKENKWELSTEVYYKWMQNQIDYKDAADLVFNENIETQLRFGEGRAYGTEFLIRKKKGQLTGWLGYTLSRTEKKIDGVNNGTWYAARQDKTHDLSVVGMWALSAKWNLSATWVYSTGNAVSFPDGKYIIDGTIVYSYSSRNGYRMPAYHRLDLGATVKLGHSTKVESELMFGVYNAYGRANPYMITFEQNEYDPSRTEIKRVTLFKFVPSVTYNFKF